jgi:hypothetical protein
MSADFNDDGQLEVGLTPSTFTVLNLLDDGPDSLRAAIAAANGNAGADVIEFAEDLNGTITLGSELSITDDLTINGLGEPSAAMTPPGCFTSAATRRTSRSLV